MALAPWAPLSAAEIINNISTSASSGGNSAGAGEVIEGKSRVKVKIYTEIDGEVVTDFEEIKTASDGEEIKIEKHAEVTQEKKELALSVLSMILKYVFGIL